VGRERQAHDETEKNETDFHFEPPKDAAAGEPEPEPLAPDKSLATCQQLSIR